ncbi:MAG: ATP phosphoribosyltransferase regulatory subunit [Myxococcales bacterium]|nr:ATP phosphoribosyltransferase regulatory subunit [Myxococcales bacterium]
MTTVPQRATPVGVRDYTPELADAFYTLQGELMAAFKGAGYTPIITPTFELAAVFELGIGPEDAARVLRFVDPQNGDVLALRSDITPQIARLVSGPMRHVAPPLRLSYFGRVFRLRQHVEFQRREVAQAGIELIGASGAAADIEVLRVCDSALAAVSPSPVVLSLGHVGLLRALLGRLPETVPLTALRERIRRKDRAGTLAILAEAGVSTADAAPIGALVGMHGAPGPVLSAAAALAERVPALRPALAELEAVVSGLVPGLACELLLDLGEMLGFDYYTGVVFHAYLDGAGSAVASGGRYDTLLARYGRDLPAAGFAVDGEVLTEARATRNAPSNAV